MIRTYFTAGILLLLLICFPAAAADVSTGAISVISSPTGADVYVDDVFVGVTDNAFVNIPQGDRTIRVVKAGYHEYTNTVYVPGGPSANTVPMSADLVRSTDLAGLVVDSVPEGAAVYVDDIYKGTTHYGGGLQIADLTPGQHTIRLEMDGYKPYTVTSYQTSAGYATYLTNVKLSRIATPTPTATAVKPTNTATILLDATPEVSSVYLDTVFRGYAPQTLDNLAPGTYSLTVSRSGYTTWQTTVTVAEGDMITQTAILSAAATAPAAPTKAPLGPVAACTGIVLALAAVLLLRH